MFPQHPELSVPTVAGLLLVALAVNLACVLLVATLLDRYVRRSSPSSGGGGDAASAAAVPGTGAGADTPERHAVRCPECAAENDSGYRYCRACVSRLPRRGSVDREAVPRFGRFAD